jgi:hypothetical protein
MLVPFDQLPDSARIWIFQSSARLTDVAAEDLQRVTESFVENWTAHQAALHGAVIIVDHRFLVVAVDEEITGASGCSIDKLSQFMRGREQAMNVKWFDRLLVSYKDANGDAHQCRLSDIEEKLHSGELSGETPVYDTTVENVGAFRSRFIIALKNTWLNRYQIAG